MTGPTLYERWTDELGYPLRSRPKKPTVVKARAGLPGWWINDRRGLRKRATFAEAIAYATGDER